MKKLYSLLTVLMACIACSFQAFAAPYSVTVNVDDVNRVSVAVAGTTLDNIVNGDNVLNFPEQPYNQVTIKAKDGYVLKSVQRTNGTLESIYYLTECNIYTNEGDNNVVFTVTSGELVRDASCTINVDDASATRVYFPNTNRTLTLENGEQTVQFSSELENNLNISSTDYSKPLYKVQLNGSDATAQYGSYNLTLSDGDVVDIQAKFPDKDCNITISVSEGAEACFKSATLNGTAVENPLEGFTAKAGDNLYITYDYYGYKVESFIVNGVPEQYIYGSYSTVVTDDLNIELTAHPYGNLSFTIDIDNPAAVTFYRGYSYQGNVISLEAGVNTVEIPESDATLSWAVTSGYFFTSFTDGENDYSNYSQITITDGMALTVRTAEIVRDKTVVVYVDDTTAAEYGFNSIRSDRSYIALVSGYNNVPFQFGAYGAPVTKLYINGEERNPDYDGGTSFTFMPADGDIIMFYLAAEPSTHNVTFDVTAESTEVSVLAHHYTAIEDFTTPFSALTGSHVTVVPADASKVDVSVNGETANPDENGEYTIAVTADTTVKVADKEENGIENITTTAGLHDVYNLQGVLVRKNATASEISSLPAGIYVAGGKKVIVK